MQDIFLGNPPALIFAKENLGRRINFAYFSCSVSSRIPLSLSLVNVFLYTVFLLFLLLCVHSLCGIRWRSNNAREVNKWIQFIFKVYFWRCATVGSCVVVFSGLKTRILADELWDVKVHSHGGFSRVDCGLTSVRIAAHLESIDSSDCVRCARENGAPGSYASSSSERQPFLDSGQNEDSSLLFTPYPFSDLVRRR